MELAESIEEINRHLKDEYGVFEDGRQHFRVVFSDDQFEKRWVDRTLEGFELLNPEVQLRPKYRQYIQGKYLIERLVPVGPDTDLLEKTSYEVLHVFMDKNKNYLPPRYDMAKFFIDTLLAASGQKSDHAKYVDPAIDPEFRKNELLKMQERLFGNETDLGDALAHGWGESFSGLDGRPSKGEING